MNFRIEKRIGIQAPADRIWDSLADLSFWSRWNPVETDASGVIGFGGEIRLTETLPATLHGRSSPASATGSPWPSWSGPRSAA